MKFIIKDYQTQSEFHQFVLSSYSHLMLMKKDGDKTAFNELMLKVLPQVKIYIAQKLNSAIENNTIPKGKYRPDDFVEYFDPAYASSVLKELDPSLSGYLLIILEPEMVYTILLSLEDGDGPILSAMLEDNYEEAVQRIEDAVKTGIAGLDEADRVG